MMSEYLEKLRLEFDMLLNTQTKTLTNPEIIRRGLELEEKLSNQQ